MNPPLEHFAEKLNMLLEEKRKPDGTKYAQAEIIEGTQGVLTRVYLWKLRTGRAANPGYHVIKAIADFFGVDPSFFFEGEGQTEGQQELRDELVGKIALRSTMLDEDGKKHILDMIDYILKTRNGGSDES